MAFTPQGVARGFGLFLGVLFFLYFFLIGLDLLGNGFKVVAGDSAGELFGFAENPIAGLMVGIIATVLVQSSSTTTSVIVTAVGAGVLEVTTAIPMVMGANIGTSVTNTIVSVGFIGDKEQYRRGFAGATVHDMFNYMNVIFWLPLEIIVSAINGGDGGILFLVSKAIAKSFEACESEDPDACEKWEGPLKKITAAIAKKLISVDKDVIKDFAIGVPDAEQCAVLCKDALLTVETTNATEADCKAYKFNRKKCTDEELVSNPLEAWCKLEDLPDFNETAYPDFDSKNKPKFEICRVVTENGKAVTEYIEDVGAAAVRHYDSYKLVKGGVFEEKYGWQTEAGWFNLIFGLILMIMCLIGLVKCLSAAIRGSSEEVLKKALNMNGYLAILVGCAVTIFVQSSSITTSTLTPLVAIGTLSLEGMLPLTLGANIGTTVTGILAALVGDKVDGFQIAVVHVLFNVFGVILFYPIPKIRAIPIGAARRLGDLAAAFKIFPIFYIFMLFVVYPGVVLGLSIAFESGSSGAVAGGVIGLLFLLIAHIALFFWYHRKGGREFLEEIFGRDLEGTHNPKVDTEIAP